MRDILFADITLDFRKVSGFEGGVYDRRPCVGEGFVEAPVYGIYGEKVSDIEVRGFKVKTSSLPEGEFGGLFHWVDCTDIKAL